jgi:hypothetical protein
LRERQLSQQGFTVCLAEANLFMAESGSGQGVRYCHRGGDGMGEDANGVPTTESLPGQVNDLGVADTVIDVGDGQATCGGSELDGWVGESALPGRTPLGSRKLAGGRSIRMAPGKANAAAIRPPGSTAGLKPR